jgi:hypothetical protein
VYTADALQAAKHCVLVASSFVCGALPVSAPPPQPASIPAISASSTPLFLFSIFLSYYFERSREAD